MKILGLVLALGFLGTAAHAGTGAKDVVSHPVLQGLEKLLNKQYGGRCVTPKTDDDLQWMCMGLIPSVSAPTLIDSSCAFTAQITCDGNVTVVTGRTSSIGLLLPSGKFDSHVVPVNGIYITDISSK